MNKHKLAILGFSVMLLAASCRKMDVQRPEPTAPATTAAVAAAPAAPAVSEWRSVAAWTSTKEEKYTSFSSRIQDSSLTSSVIANGLVLVYKKDGSNNIALPAQEAGTNKYWYYSVSEGEITINVDAYGTEQKVGQTPEIKYYVITENMIKDLEASGKNKISLMGLNYSEAQSLFQK